MSPKPEKIPRKPIMPRKKVAIGAAILVIVALGAIFFPRGDKQAAHTRLVTVETATLEETVTAQGKLEPKEYVDVGTQVSGQLKKIHVEIGDTVEKGHLLAEIDPEIYESRLEASMARANTLKAQLTEQQANLVLAQQQLARNKRLIDAGAISREALEESENAQKAAQARVNSVKAQIQEIESTLKGDRTNLAYTKITAPMSGTVVTLPAREGQTLNASQTAPTLLQLANLDIMTLRAQVAEADIMRLAPGMAVYFTTLGSLEKRWEGKVAQVLPTPELVNDVVLYHVLIDADNRDRKLMNGMSAQVFFVLGKAENVPSLPLEALGKRLPDADNENGSAYLVHLASGEERQVHVGLMDRTKAEIRTGLTSGEKVAVRARQPQTGEGGNRQGGGRRGGFGGGPRL